MLRVDLVVWFCCGEGGLGDLGYLGDLGILWAVWVVTSKTAAAVPGWGIREN